MLYLYVYSLLLGVGLWVVTLHVMKTDAEDPEPVNEVVHNREVDRLRLGLFTGKLLTVGAAIAILVSLLAEHT